MAEVWQANAPRAGNSLCHSAAAWILVSNQQQQQQLVVGCRVVRKNLANSTIDSAVRAAQWRRFDICVLHILPPASAAINNDLAKRCTPSALLAAAESDSETNTPIRPVAPACIPSSVPRRVLAPVAVKPISPFSAPASAPTTTAGGAAGACAFYAHLAAHAAFTMTIHKPSQQMPSKGRGRGKQQPKVGMCSFCGETDSPMWRKGPEEYPHLCNRCDTLPLAACTPWFQTSG